MARSGQCNPKLVSFAIAGAINWIGTWYHPDGELSPQEIAAEYARILTGWSQQAIVACNLKPRNTRLNLDFLTNRSVFFRGS